MKRSVGGFIDLPTSEINKVSLLRIEYEMSLFGSIDGGILESVNTVNKYNGDQTGYYWRHD